MRSLWRIAHPSNAGGMMLLAHGLGIWNGEHASAIDVYVCELAQRKRHRHTDMSTKDAMRLNRALDATRHRRPRYESCL